MIKPAEIEQAVTSNIDSEVFAAVDQLLVKNWTGRSAVFNIDDVVKLILELKGYNGNEPNYREVRSSLFDNKQLEFENYYREAGWSVVYDSPGYNESYVGFWRFEKEDPDSPQALKREIRRLNKLLKNS